MKDKNLGDWCKWYEKNFSPEQMIPKLPVIIRIDGNNFSKWTKNLEKPFCSEFSDAMVELTKFLVSETNAVIGYTQSDEISLILYSDNVKKPIYNDGEKQKILSKLTSKLSNYFNRVIVDKFPSLRYKDTAAFDCRIYQVPTLQDACAQLIWRENDAVRNSISLLSESLFPSSELNGIDQNLRQDKMMLEKGVNWNDVEVRFKRGVYVRRKEISIKYKNQDIKNLPEKHTLRFNPNLEIKRRIIDKIDVPPINKITNLIDFVFKGADPISIQ